MPETCAQRTLVKSPPELWAEISDAPSLARRLSAFGEVRITRKDPETAVAWEGASVRGTVELAASGWGTKVTITAERLPQAPAEPEQDTTTFDSAALAAHADEPEATADAEATGTDIPPQDAVPVPPEGFIARLKGWWHTGRWAAQPAAAPTHTPTPTPTQVAPADPPVAVEVPEVEPVVRSEPAEPAQAPDPELEGTLVAVLDDLGSAHHRPFSRA